MSFDAAQLMFTFRLHSSKYVLKPEPSPRHPIIIVISLRQYGKTILSGPSVAARCLGGCSRLQQMVRCRIAGALVFSVLH